MSINRFTPAGHNKIEITPKQAAYIRANYNRQSLAEMAHNLSVSDTKVSKWMTELTLKKTRVSWKREKLPIKEGFFNPDGHENWIV
jgi:hypothetical protein